MGRGEGGEGGGLYGPSSLLQEDTLSLKAEYSKKIQADTYKIFAGKL